MYIYIYTHYTHVNRYFDVLCTCLYGKPSRLQTSFPQLSKYYAVQVPAGLPRPCHVVFSGRSFVLFRNMSWPRVISFSATRLFSKLFLQRVAGRRLHHKSATASWKISRLKNRTQSKLSMHVLGKKQHARRRKATQHLWQGRNIQYFRKPWIIMRSVNMWEWMQLDPVRSMLKNRAFGIFPVMNSSDGDPKLATKHHTNHTSITIYQNVSVESALNFCKSQVLRFAATQRFMSFEVPPGRWAGDHRLADCCISWQTQIRKLVKAKS